MTIKPRHIRNLQSLSEDECALLGSKRVAVVGCGGLGGYAIEMLARLGMGSIVAIDSDAFEESNLNRQILATEATLGRSKAEVAAERVATIDPDVQVRAVCARLEEDNARSLVEGCDCAVDCLDSVEARFWLAHACGELGIPVVYGAIGGWFGQVCTVMPGDPSFVTVYGAIDRGTGVHETLGNLPFTAACTASFQAAECAKVLLGRPDVLRNRLLMIDLLDGSCEEMELR